KPFLHFVRVYGTRMMIEVDFNHMTTVVHRVSSLPKAAEKATYNLDESWQRARSTVSNMYRFLRGTLRPYHGMMTLIHGFYDAVGHAAPVPVSKDRALAVVKTMDAVFEQLQYQPLLFDRIVPAARPLDHRKKVLVTGGTGFVGKRLVKRLLDDG